MKIVVWDVNSYIFLKKWEVVVNFIYFYLKVTCKKKFFEIRMFTRDHLLLACEYSNDVWYYVFQRCGAPGTLIISWPELLSWIRNAATGPLAILRRMATQATIYHLWKQRNNLIHNQISLSPHVVFQGLKREVRNGISARRHLKKFSSLMVLWLR